MIFRPYQGSFNATFIRGLAPPATVSSPSGALPQGLEGVARQMLDCLLFFLAHNVESGQLVKHRIVNVRSDRPQDAPRLYPSG